MKLGQQVSIVTVQVGKAGLCGVDQLCYSLQHTARLENKGREDNATQVGTGS